jgi:uncharacterized protein YlxP (DUF503 family)
MKPGLGVTMLSIRIPLAGSLKDRRQVVRSLSERMKKHFNASAADLGPEGQWNAAELAVACAGSSCQEMETRVARLAEFAERAEENGEFDILDLRSEVFAYGDFQD